jgi:hypothetical protein
MKSRTLQWLAIILIVQSGVLHLIDAQAEYQKIPHMGYMTMVFVFGALVAALLIYRRFQVGRVIGLIVAASSIILFVLTRTVAFPGLAVDQWLYPFWLIAAIVEGLYLLLFLVASLWKPSVSVDRNPASPRRLSFLLPLFGAILISGVTYGTDRWDNFAYQLGYHHHVGTFSAVCNTPPITLEELEQQHGVKISRVAISMMGSIVDVRLEITDPEKAKAFLENQGAILVNQEVLIVSPHVHTHFRLRTNRVFVAFFSTQRGTVHTGSEVSLVYGTVRVEPVVVQ